MVAAAREAGGHLRLDRRTETGRPGRRSVHLGPVRRRPLRYGRHLGAEAGRLVLEPAGRLARLRRPWAVMNGRPVPTIASWWRKGHPRNSRELTAPGKKRGVARRTSFSTRPYPGRNCRWGGSCTATPGSAVKFEGWQSARHPNVGPLQVSSIAETLLERAGAGEPPPRAAPAAAGPLRVQAAAPAVRAGMVLDFRPGDRQRRQLSDHVDPGPKLHSG